MSSISILLGITEIYCAVSGQRLKEQFYFMGGNRSCNFVFDCWLGLGIGLMLLDSSIYN